MSTKNKNIVHLNVRTLGDPNRRITEKETKQISKFLKLDEEGREKYLKEVRDKEEQKK